MYRGPQLVQLMNGYLYLLLSGSNNSCTQSSHIDTSGGITEVEEFSVDFLLVLILNSLYSSFSTFCMFILSILDNGGFSVFNWLRNLSILFCGPSIRIFTPDPPRFRT